MNYDLPLWRPPSEGENLIIQASIGCGFNHCSFCTMYRDKTYRQRPMADVLADIDEAAIAWPDAHRVFLADGDAWGLPTPDLLAIVAHLRRRFPNLQRVSAYATPFNLIRKSVEDLASLRDAGMNLAYVGIESGSDWLLKRIVKGSAKQMEAGLARGLEAGLKISATVITGLGGKSHWQDHMIETAALVNRVPPTFLSTLQLVLDERSEPVFREAYGDGFVPQDDDAVLDELHLLLERLDPPKPVIFRSNHASNALALAGNLPKDKGRLLAQIQAARSGGQGMRPRWMRGL